MNAAAGTAPQIAVVGMAARFPGAADVDEFWQNLLDGVPAHQAAGLDPSGFDAEFFDISADEATLMDPQHRMFIECCWHAMEAAGYDPRSAPGVGAVFGGCSFPVYLVLSLMAQHGLAGGHISLATALANDRDALTARTAYHLDLRGPVLTVQAFSATGLVAVHLAAQSLLLGDCDLAVAGVASVCVTELPEGPVPASRSGVCAPLDARADGTLPGNAVAVVVLRRLDDAVRDGDHVHALLAGSAVTHEGGRSHGFLVPGTAAKAEAMAEALAVAGLTPEDLGYIEAQAVGEPVSDALEVAAVDRVFDGSPSGASYRMGSVAANVGHLDAAAGMAGLIKAILMVERGWIPPQPGFRVPAAALARARTRFMVAATEAQPWTAPDDAGMPVPRRCGVNSFGIGGTNAHAVVCQAPSAPAITDLAEDLQLFVVSARDDKALRRAAEAVCNALAANWSSCLCTSAVPAGTAPDGGAVSPANVAYTLQIGRASLQSRSAFLARTPGGVLRGLEQIAQGMTGPGELADDVEADQQAVPPSPAATGIAATGIDEAASWRLIARRWLAGEHIDWQDAHRGRPRLRVPLPGYPFDHRRFWVEPDISEESQPPDMSTDTSTNTTPIGV
jgi:acyl transferase domain-containing protein